MAPFDRLPYEIRTDILSRLSQDDLFYASRVSHDWCTISEPLLYSEPELWELLRDPSSCYPFLRTLLTPGRERLAGLVRSLSVHYREPFVMRLPGNPPVPYATPYLLQPDRHATGATHVVLLMHLLPRLHTLHLMTDGPPGSFQTFIEAHHAYSHTNMLPPALQSLREFRWSPERGVPLASVTLLLTMLKLPCMHTVDVALDGTFGMPVSGTAVSTAALTGTSTVTRLALSFDGESCEWLTRILLIPRTLTYLSCSIYPVHPFDLSHLGTALEPLKNSLNHLNLEVTAYEHDVTNTIGSLRSWPVLHSVRISLIVLLGAGYGSLAHLLPVCLRELQLIGSSDAVLVRTVVQLLEGREVMLPGLERLAVYLNGMTFQDCMHVVDEACEAAGVEFVDSCFPWVT